MTIDQIITDLDSLNIPFSGTTIKSGSKKYHISPFQQISISGIGPVFYINKTDQKIYTLLQRRYKDNFQWWFPGGYVELPWANHGFFAENFEKIKNATIDDLYKNSLNGGSWQKARKEINDPKKLEKSFKKHGLKWPQEIDANWQSAWQREVLEETGVDLDQFPQKIILDFKFNHTLMIGAERDRLTNIDGKFCAMLGVLDEAPETTPDHETEELKWIAIDEINFAAEQKNYFACEKQVNLYTVTLIEEALFELICGEIKRLSKFKNPFNGQEIARFNTPQNLQGFLLERLRALQILKQVQDEDGGSDDSECQHLPRCHPELVSGSIHDHDLNEITTFLSWQFGEMQIGENLTGKNSNKLYKTNIVISEFLASRNLSSKADFTALNNLIKNIK